LKKDVENKDFKAFLTKELDKLYNSELNKKNNKKKKTIKKIKLNDKYYNIKNMFEKTCFFETGEISCEKIDADTNMTDFENGISYFIKIDLIKMEEKINKDVIKKDDILWNDYLGKVRIYSLQKFKKKKF